MSETGLDDDGYPTDEALARISAWPQDDYRNLMAYVRALWWAADWGWDQQYDPHGAMEYHVSTAGWSGNESLLGAMRENHMFWVTCWRQVRCGGHYIFKVKGR